MVNILIIVGATLIATLSGFGAFWWLWYITRPTKQVWKARIYQLADSVQNPIRNKKGEIVSDLKLSELKPLGTDFLEKVEKEPGNIIYRLKRLNKVTSEVTQDCVEHWDSKGLKEVCVLLEGEVATVLKKGYERKSGIIFTPMPFERINMITANVIAKRNRLQDEKDILQSITPFIVVGISMLALIMVVYFSVDGLIKISDRIDESSQRFVEAQLKINNETLTRLGYRQIENPTPQIGVNTENKTVPQVS